MAQPTTDDSFDSLEDLDFPLTNYIHPSSPNEEFNFPAPNDAGIYEPLYEFDVTDLNISLYPEQLFRDILNDFRSVAPSPVNDEINELLTESTEVIHSTETNDINDPIQSSDEQKAMIKSSNRTLPVIRPSNEKSPSKSSNDQSILLSRSVAVTNLTPKQLQLIYGLEDTYRARYKSDYFPSKGAVRRPRYVADNAGNHFITLKMPTEYTCDYKNEYIRIALLTTSIDGRGHYYSPYKFQVNHDDVKVPDENPMFIPVQGFQKEDSTMKLHLVLIKSKLDQLNHAQPLKPFSDSIGNVQNIITTGKLSPKDLINQYQLDKSHIAFTLCTKLSDDKYDIHPETTVISSVITEVANKPSTTSNNKSEASTMNTEKQISCPNCAHCFNMADGEVAEKGNKRKMPSKVMMSSTNKKKKSTS